MLKNSKTPIEQSVLNSFALLTKCIILATVFKLQYLSLFYYTVIIALMFFQDLDLN